MFHLLQSQPTTVKDWLPLISVVVTILLFTTDRLIGISIRRREARRTWYLKILIDPNIGKISEFFDKIGNAYEKASVALTGAQGTQNYLTLKAKNFEIFIDLKRQLTAYLIQPLTVQYFPIAEALTNKLTELEDNYTQSLDSGLFTPDNINTFKIQAYNIKAEMLDILYIPIAAK